MSVIKEKFGQIDTKEEVFKYTLKNDNGVKLIVTDLGASIVSIIVPDKEGKMRDVVLGYDTPLEYQKNTCYFGATIGPNANRIANARCVIEGKTYELEANDNENNLHSGSNGLHSVVWDVEEISEKNIIIFSHQGRNLEQGFPGDMLSKITYQLTEKNEVVVKFEAQSDNTSVANFTNHVYFNLSGHDSGSIENHDLKIYSKSYTPVIDSKAIPTGEIQLVKDTPLDFCEMKKIGRDINQNFEQLSLVGGYDHNYVLDNAKRELKLVAKAKSEETGISMIVYADSVGIQFYSGNFIYNQKGKNGVEYNKRQGFCLEPQYFPNSINESLFDSPIIEPNQKYKQTLKLEFNN